MSALTRTAENRTLDWLTGRPTTAPVADATGHLQVRLVTVNGDDTTNGTEVVNTATSNYQRQPVKFSIAATGQASNDDVVRFDNMPDLPITTGAGGTYVSGGVVGFEIWDFAATPVRWWFAPLTTPRSYQAGDAAEFPAGQLVLAID